MTGQVANKLLQLLCIFYRRRYEHHILVVDTVEDSVLVDLDKARVHNVATILCLQHVTLIEKTVKDVLHGRGRQSGKLRETIDRKRFLGEGKVPDNHLKVVSTVNRPRHNVRKEMDLLNFRGNQDKKAHGKSTNN